MGRLTIFLTPHDTWGGSPWPCSCTPYNRALGLHGNHLAPVLLREACHNCSVKAGNQVSTLTTHRKGNHRWSFLLIISTLSCVLPKPKRKIGLTCWTFVGGSGEKGMSPHGKLQGWRHHLYLPRFCSQVVLGVELFPKMSHHEEKRNFLLFTFRTFSAI